MEKDEPRIAAWDARVDWPLTGLAFAFLGLYAWQVLDTALTPAAYDALDVALTVIWLLLGADYVVRLTLARRKRRFVRRHLLDLVVLLLPMFRPLRALRVLTALRVLNRQLRGDFRGRVGLYVGATVGLVGFVAALAVLEAERDAPDASITSFGEAVWWTITTISTVGYGDRYPVTTEGRIVAATLMIAGIALLGVVTASIATVFVENVRRAGEQLSEDVEEVEADVVATQVQLVEVLAELRAISARLDALERGRGAGPTSHPAPGPDRSAPSARSSA